ncbi:unnamed protein product [Arabidopsis halleri]
MDAPTSQYLNMSQKIHKCDTIPQLIKRFCEIVYSSCCKGVSMFSLLVLLFYVYPCCCHCIQKYLLASKENSRK